MPADIITLPTGANVSAAWDVYAGLVRQLFIRPALQHDAGFMTRLAQAEEKYRVLFIKQGTAESRKKAATL